MRRRRLTTPRYMGQNTPHNPVVRDADGIDRIAFGSVGEAVIDSMADYAQNEGNQKMLAGWVKTLMLGNNAWANYFTRERLLDTIQNPPKELLDAVEEMRQSLLEEVEPPTTTRRQVRRNQEWGDELTPESVLVRSLTPWERMTRESQPRRTVTIGVNLSVDTTRRAKHLLWRGAAAAALADILTQRGLSVEIVAFWSASKISTGCRRLVGRFMVKRSDMSLDVGAVAVALAEIAFARLAALFALSRHVEGLLDENLGYADPLPPQDRSGIDYLAEEDILDRGAAVSWLRRSANLQESEALHA